MKINAINSFNNVNFEGKRNKKAEVENNLPAQNNKSNGFMSNLKAPVAAAMFMLPVTGGMYGCGPDVDIKIHRKIIILPGCGCDKPVNPDIKVLPTSLDSLYKWINDDLDIPSTDGDGNEKRKVMTKFSSKRNWEYNHPEIYELNLVNTDGKIAVYDHSVNNVSKKVSATVVNPGDITVVDYDGNERNDIGGVMFNEKGSKQFIHSNGKNQLIVYKQSKNDANKFEYKGIVSRGVLSENEYGKNILLMDILSPGTGESLVNVEKFALGREELLDKIANAKETTYIEVE